MSDTADILNPESPHTPPRGLAERVKALLQNKEFERFSKFLVVGTVGAVIDFGTFRGLDALNWFQSVQIMLPFGLPLTEPGITGGISFTLAVISNFFWNRYWTYPDSRSKPLAWQFGTFFVVNVAGLLIRVPILEFLSVPFGNLAYKFLPQLGQQSLTAVGRSAAWALAVTIVLFWNFFVNRYWTYSDVK